MTETDKKFLIDSLIKYLTMYMILFVSAIVVTHILIGKFDTGDILMGIGFIFFLVVLKWIIKESGIE